MHTKVVVPCFHSGLRHLPERHLATLAYTSMLQAKQRPLTDPLIVHVPDTASALAVVDFEGEGGGGDRARRLLALLGEKLWPG